MLTNEEVDYLLSLLKRRKTKELITFPDPGCSLMMELESVDKKEYFLIDVNRKGAKVKKSKCTYQERYRKDTILLRLDIDGPGHTNPDGEVISGSHLHTYKEGYEDKFAVEIPENLFSDTKDLVTTLIDFFEYCKVENAHNIAIQRGLF